jgi:NitT/TauT family transport system substrate-binding protein
MRFMKSALAGVFALGLVGAAIAAEPVKIRMSWVAPVSNWASIVLEKKDLAKHLGKSYVIESVRYQGTPQMITAIANNELEVSNLAYSSLAIAIETPGSTTSASSPMNSRTAWPAAIAPSTTCARTQASPRSRTSKAR